MRLLTLGLVLCLCLVFVSCLENESDRARRPKPSKGKGKSKPKPKPKPPQGKGAGGKGAGGKGSGTPGGKGSGLPGGKGSGSGVPGGKGSGSGVTGGKGSGMGLEWQKVWQLLQELRRTLIALQQSGAGRPGGNGGGSGTGGGKGTGTGGGKGPGCEDKVCPEIYTPVCGADGKTYSNDCKACGVQVSCQGECPCTGGSGTTGSPSASTPKPVTGDGESEIKIRQTWCQEPNGFDRRAIVRQPTTSTPGEKVPVVVCLHGNGGQATFAQWKELWDKNMIVAAEGYDRSWNIYKEASKAPDVEFIEALIAKVGEEYPNADMDNVVLVGYSNGAGMIHRLLVESNPRPFHKVFPMASTLTTNQYNSGKFWKPAPKTSADCEDGNIFDIEVTPAGPGPEIYTVQGTDDGAIPYTGGSGVASNTFLAAQDVLFLYAKTLFGYSGSQLSDSAGEETSVQDVLKYSYLNGKLNHYKVIGGTHGNTSKNIWPIVKAIINSSK